MYFDSSKNLMLDALFGTNPTAPVTHVAVHSAFDIGGGNEVSSARVAISMGSATNGTITSTGTPTISMPGGSTAAFFGLWSAVTLGTIQFMAPVGSTKAKAVEGDTDDTIYARAHGFINDEQVTFYGDDLPTGITQGDLYFVVNASADTFQISLTQGGAAIDITADGFGTCYNIAPESFTGAGTLDLSSLVATLNLVT
jgi:hypothetical protein